ncbi:MAG TPA: two-component regulator propeller domain-containing protein, partial [Roseateles sp.]
MDTAGDDDCGLRPEDDEDVNDADSTRLAHAEPANGMRARLGRWLAPMLLGCMICLPGQAANPWAAGATTVFHRAALPAGLSPTTMLQARDGLIWIGTQTGLVRWDGYQFQRDYGDFARDDLRSVFVSCLYEDDAGQLWVGTLGRGVLRLDLHTGEVHAMAAPGTPAPRVRTMAPDRQGGLWVGAHDGLSRLQLGPPGKQGPGPGVPPGLPEKTAIAALLMDRRGDLWVSSAAGLFVLRTSAATFQPVPLLAGGKPVKDVGQLLEDEGGRLWVATLTSGVFVLDPVGGGSQRVMDGERREPQPLEARLGPLADAGNGEVWLGTTTGLVTVDTATLRARRLRRDPTDATDAASDAVPTLYRDRDGLMWIGGLEMLAATDPRQQALFTWPAGGGRLSGGRGAQVQTLLARRDGSLWVADLAGGIDIIAPDRGSVRHLAAQPGRPRQALSQDYVMSMAEAPDGRVFLGTFNDLYVASPDGRQVERVDVPSMPAMRVAALCFTGNRLWIGGNQGLLSWDLSTRQSTVPPAVAGRAVRVLACEAEDALLVGTSAGLFRYRPGTGALERLEAEQTDGGGRLLDGWVSSLARDRHGRLWVSYFGSGVCRLDPGAAQPRQALRCFGDKDGIQDNAANAVALDAEANAWVSTDNGLARIDATSLEVTPLRDAEGVGLRAHLVGAVAALPDGDLVFGGKGLSIVRPGQYRPRVDKAPLMLTHVSAGLQPSGDIRLPPDVRAVQMGFALLDYGAPERVRYAYRLAGLEEAWTPASMEARVARYTNLKPGDYQFEVRALGRGGDWTTRRWPLHVEPAWHETPLARAAFGVIAALLLWLLLHLRTRWLRHRAAQLAELVSQRTRELQQRGEQLEASRQALRELGAHNALALEEERKRVARELHDELGQQLVALRLEMSVLKASGDA